MLTMKKQKDGNRYTAADVIRSFREWQSVRFSLKPRRIMLLFIIGFNVVFLLISAWIISRFALPGNENLPFLPAVYNTLTMILDAGCIESIIQDPGNTNLFLMLFCLVVIIISMITFTGALIGYVTNVISSLIENANNNSRRLNISDHVVILGWNTRASEMINDLLFCEEKQIVVVLSDHDRGDILRESEERIHETIARENSEIREACRTFGFLKKHRYLHKHLLRNNISLIVREGDIYSSVQLNNVRLENAKSIIILCDSSGRPGCVFEPDARALDREKSNSRTIKALMQVVDITSKVTSKDGQKVVVEVDNDWTERIVDKIIKNKQQLGKVCVVPFRVHRVMGQLLCQFSLMPELNMVYRELFSNKGATIFASQEDRAEGTASFISDYLESHTGAVPLTHIRDQLTGKDYCYYMATSLEEALRPGRPDETPCALRLNRNYWIDEKYVLVLGSNSKIDNILKSFQSFHDEWSDANHPDILHVTVLDEEDKLKKADYYRNYAFIQECIPAGIYEEEVITRTITDFTNRHPENASILILSDDMITGDDTDAKALSFLIYTKDIINRARVNKRNEAFDIDIVVEIIDPKHYDILKSYDVNNVVISNRYISKMITQISENYAIYNMYVDIMTYDEEGSATFDSKEFYIKKASEYFAALPAKNTPASAIVRKVFAESRGFWGSQNDYALLLGYVDSLNRMHLFSGEQMSRPVTLRPEDKLIIYSNH